MKQVIIKKGQAVVEETPAPFVEPGTVLVQVNHSCISIGTEMTGVRVSAMPLWKRAMKQPENVKKGLQMLKEQGVEKTWSLIQGRLEAGNATGYSAAGTVIEVGEGVSDVFVGDRVACAGAQCAHHAEVIRVPRNLCVPIPDSLNFAAASTVTLGAIALQGVRRAQPTLGETFVVIGLGVLGQITSQLLKASGCKVIGLDKESKRVAQAMELGMDYGVDLSTEIDQQKVASITGGVGADGVLITAATPSDEVVSTAFKMCRKKGRVILVGDVGLNLKREDIYVKELDFLVSTSYGPGRYDRNYEEDGLDYPISYVRWTENRNMQEFLDLIAREQIQVESLVESTYPLEQATEAYAALKSGDSKPLMVLLNYPDQPVEKLTNKVVANPTAKAKKDGQIGIAIIGAGGFAKGMHLPNLFKLRNQYSIEAIVSRTGHNASATAKSFQARYATTDYNEVLKDEKVDAVCITTRHNLHFEQTMAALKAGKHVLIEKPLCMTVDELKQIEAYYQENPDAPVLLTGYNRRFSPFMQSIHKAIAQRSNPMIIQYRMNAGHIPADHWIHGEEGGGRNIGEACHIYDLFTFLTGSKFTRVHTSSINPKTDYYSHRDNFVATIDFEDGSVATLTYTALGSKQYPKEQMEIFVDGRVMEMNNYQSLTTHGASAPELSTRLVEKGQLEELEFLARTIQKGGDWPNPLWQQIQTMAITLEVEKQLQASTE